MGRIKDFKTNFTAGEIDQSLTARQDLKAYPAGAKQLRNVAVRAQGSARRRRGLRYLDSLPVDTYQTARWIFDVDEHYLLLFRDGAVDIYDTFNETKATTLTGQKWTAAMIGRLRYTQRGDTMIVCHPDLETQTISRTGLSSFTVADFAWETGNSGKRIYQPHHKYALPSVTLNPSGTSGSITLQASANVFTSDHVGVRFRLVDKEVEVTGYTDANTVTASVKETLSASSATTEWTEALFSPARGWPACALYNQGRLWFGGGRDLPDSLVATNINAYFKHDVGTGLDDEAIQKVMGGDRVSSIRALIALGDLQVFTDTSEHFVEGDSAKGYTPGATSIRKQTSFGISDLAPAVFDSAVFFVPKQLASVREFLYDDLRQSYKSDPLTVLSPHLIRTPVSLDVQLEGDGQVEQYAYVVNADGTVATFLSMREQGIAGWTLWDTPGAPDAEDPDLVHAVGVVNNQTYFICDRLLDGVRTFTLERLDPRFALDCAIEGEVATAKATWGGFTHLANMDVDCVSRQFGDDGRKRWVYLGRFTVDGSGNIDLGNIEVTHIQAGLPYYATYETLPPVTPNATGFGEPVRMVRALVNLVDTAALTVDPSRLRLRQVTDDLSKYPAMARGIYEFWLRGMSREGTVTLTQEVPLPIEVAGLVVEVEYT